jgi:hypothetical protein
LQEFFLQLPLQRRQLFRFDGCRVRGGRVTIPE